MNEALKELSDHIAAALGAHVLTSEINHGELTLRVKRAEIVRVLKFLRDDANCQFRMLVDLCGVDWPERAERFDVVYNLLSLTLNHRLRVVVSTDEVAPVSSVHTVW